MATLILIRHGQSQWNAKNLFTGWHDPDLTEVGIAEAEKAGKQLKILNIQFDLAFTSELIRAQHTLDLILKNLDQTPPITSNQALNERNYGDLNGLNKDEASKKWGKEQIHIWRRSYDTPPPGGESLQDTAKRTLLYFDTTILPALKADKNVLIIAHGNSLRALVMELEQLSAKEIVKVEIATGVPLVYELNEAGKVLSKKILK